MTMGALHAGHAALITAAREAVGPQGHVTVTVFVNPLQFGPQEDFGRYPRTPEADIDLAAERGADLVYLPSVFLMTMFGNVPMNNKLESFDHSSAPPRVPNTA